MPFRMFERILPAGNDDARSSRLVFPPDFTSHSLPFPTTTRTRTLHVISATHGSYAGGPRWLSQGGTEGARGWRLRRRNG